MQELFHSFVHSIQYSRVHEGGLIKRSDLEASVAGICWMGFRREKNIWVKHIPGKCSFLKIRIWIYDYVGLQHISLIHDAVTASNTVTHAYTISAFVKLMKINKSQTIWHNHVLVTVMRYIANLNGPVLFFLSFILSWYDAICKQ